MQLKSMPEVNVQTFRVTAAVDQEIRRHGEETYPHECCGALVGADGHATATVALPNTTEEGPRRRFMVRPSDYRAGGAARERTRRRAAGVLSFASRSSRAAVAVRSRSRVADLRVHHRRREASAAGPRREDDMTVWFLKEDRSEFEEGELNGD
mgnify:CR=1 FL=1